jgi:F-type H+-transporting ATPase subunit b
VEAARKLLAGHADAKAGADLFKASLQEVKSKLN